jgi:hypothetical protein
MLPPRTPIQRSKTQNPLDSKAWSTYQDEYTAGLTSHGSLIKHYGNDAFIPTNSLLISSINQTKRPFVSPSYQNLTANAFISNRCSDNYTDNFRTSHDNAVLYRPLYTAPTRTKLDHLFKVDAKSVAPLDQNALYKHNFLENVINDRFVSEKWLKTETMNLRDTIVNIFYADLNLTKKKLW